MIQKNKRAFTLVELIVVITILAILGTIAFLSLQGYSKSARDSRRISDISNIKTSLELFSINTGFYPEPDNGLDVDYNTELVYTQGTIGGTVTTNLSRNLHKKPLDPLFDLEYIYSLATSKKEYEVMSIHEGDLATNNLINSSYAASNYTVRVGGNYNEVFVKTTSYIVPMPSIISSENLPLDLFSTPAAISSMIVTNGTNFPDLNISNTTQTTGELAMNLSVTGAIDSNSTDAEKISVIDYIQAAYNGSDLESGNIYQNILTKTTDEDKLALVDYIILNNGSAGTLASNESTPNGNDEFTKLLIHSDNNSAGFDTLEDNFTGNNGDYYDASKWTHGSTVTHIPTIQDNKLYLEGDSTGQVGRSNVGLDYQLLGDFDVQLDFETLTQPTGNQASHITLNASTEDDAFYILRGYYSGQVYRSSSMVNGVRDSSPQNVSTSDTSGKLRLTRVGSTATTYYWNGSSWAQIISRTVSSEPMKISATMYGPQDTGIYKTYIDNFSLFSTGNEQNIAFDDSSSSSNHITSKGSTHHNNTQSVFGSSSMYFDGDGDYLSIPDSEDWDFGTGDFTIDFWANPQGGSSGIGQYTYNSNQIGWIFRYLDSANKWQFYYSDDGSNVGERLAVETVVNSNEWNHVALIRSGGTLSLYINGIIKDTYDISTGTIHNSNLDLHLGVHDSSGYQYYDGYMDEIRISKGVARWTENFTPSSVPYGN